MFLPCFEKTKRRELNFSLHTYSLGKYIGGDLYVPDIVNCTICNCWDKHLDLSHWWVWVLLSHMLKYTSNMLSNWLADSGYMLAQTRISLEWFSGAITSVYFYHCTKSISAAESLRSLIYLYDIPAPQISHASISSYFSKINPDKLAAYDYSIYNCPSKTFSFILLFLFYYFIGLITM